MTEGEQGRQDIGRSRFAKLEYMNFLMSLLGFWACLKKSNASLISTEGREPEKEKTLKSSFKAGIQPLLLLKEA